MNTIFLREWDPTGWVKDEERSLWGRDISQFEIAVREYSAQILADIRGPIAESVTWLVNNPLVLLGLATLSLIAAKGMVGSHPANLPGTHGGEGIGPHLGEATPATLTQYEQQGPPVVIEKVVPGYGMGVLDTVHVIFDQGNPSVRAIAETAKQSLPAGTNLIETNLLVFDGSSAPADDGTLRSPDRWTSDTTFFGMSKDANGLIYFTMKYEGGLVTGIHPNPNVVANLVSFPAVQKGNDLGIDTPDGFVSLVTRGVGGAPDVVHNPGFVNRGGEGLFNISLRTGGTGVGSGESVGGVTTPVVVATSVPSLENAVVAPSSGFNAIQEQIASQGNNYTLNSDGTLEQQTKDGVKIVSWLKFDPRTGECTFYGGASSEACDPNSIVIGADNSVTIDLKNGDKWTTVNGIDWAKLDTFVNVSPTAEAPQIPPEILTAIDQRDARNKILPFCKVHADLTDSPGSSRQVYASIPTIPGLWKLIGPGYKSHEILGYGSSIVNQLDGSGGCIVVSVNDKGSNVDTRIFFESKFDGSWVEVKLTGKK